MTGYRRRLIWYTLQSGGHHGLVVVQHFTKVADFVKIIEKWVHLPIFRCKFRKIVKITFNK